MDRIERAICKLLAPALKQHGFALHKEWGGFVRFQPYGSDAFLVVNQGTSSGKYFEIKCYPAIRHDCIEIPWNTFGFIYGEESQQQTATLTYIFPRGNLPSLKVIPASMDANVASVAQELENVFTTKALPFYQRFANLAEVEKLVNNRPLDVLGPYGAGGPLEDRTIRSLLLAKAVNPARYALVREAFFTSEKKTMFPRDKCIEMVNKVDDMQLPKAP
jgi:hypothetical protein